MYAASSQHRLTDVLAAQRNTVVAYRRDTVGP
jgi:hypothetical protein